MTAPKPRPKLDILRAELDGVVVPPFPDKVGGLDPTPIAIGSDGTFFMSLQWDDQQPIDVPCTRRIFVGTPRRASETVAQGLVMMLQSTEPCALGMDGQVYYPLTTKTAILAAQQRGARIFYGYSATDVEAGKIQANLAHLAGILFPQIEPRLGKLPPKRQPRNRSRARKDNR